MQSRVQGDTTRMGGAGRLPRRAVRRRRAGPGWLYCSEAATAAAFGAAFTECSALGCAAKRTGGEGYFLSFLVSVGVPIGPPVVIGGGGGIGSASRVFASAALAGACTGVTASGLLMVAPTGPRGQSCSPEDPEITNGDPRAAKPEPLGANMFGWLNVTPSAGARVLVRYL